MAVVKNVRQLGCVSPDSRARRKVLGSSRRVRPHSLRYVTQVSSSAKFPTLWKIEDRSQEETDRQERCARGKVWNLARNFYKLKEKDQATFDSPADKWIMPAASTIKSEEREFVVDSEASMHMVSKRDFNSAELIGDHEDIEESDDGDDGQRRGANASWRNTRSSFTWEVLGYRPLDQWSETTSHQKSQTDRMQHGQLRTIRDPWSIDEFLYFIFTCFANIFIAGYCDQHGKIQQQKEVKLRVRSHGETRRVNQQKPKTQIKMETTRNYKVNYCRMCRNGYRISRRIWWIRMFNHINTLPALLINYQWSREQKWVPGPGKHSIYTHIPKEPNCGICLKTKITRASCRRRAGTVVPRAKKFGDIITADHKVLSEGSESRDNNRYAGSGTRFGNSVVTIPPVQYRNFSGDPEETNEVPGADEEATSHLHRQILRILANPVNYPGIMVRQHHTDQKQMRLLREQCVELRKGQLRYCCNQVWTITGEWMVGGFHGMLLLPAKYSGSFVWWEDTLSMKGGSEYHSTEQ